MEGKGKGKRLSGKTIEREKKTSVRGREKGVWQLPMTNQSPY